MEYFQDDLYPLTKNTKNPVLTSTEWFQGNTKEPELISLQPPGIIIYIYYILFIYLFIL